MKTFIQTILLIIILFLAACEQQNKEDLAVIQQDEETQIIDEAIDMFAIATSKAMKYPEFRQLIRTETNKQFDYDYDVLYRFIEDKDLYIKGIGEITVAELLINQIETELVNSPYISRQFFSEISKHIPTLNICVPFQYDNWDPTVYHPEVIPVLSYYDESILRIEVCDQLGNKYFRDVASSDWNDPVVVVCLSERVDNKGYLTVNAGSIYIPEEARFISAEQAYEYATNDQNDGLKNKFIPSYEIVSNEFFECSDKKSADDELNPDYTKMRNSLPGIKDGLNQSVTIATPTFYSIRPNSEVGNGVYIAWHDVLGGIPGYYELYRGFGANMSFLARIEAPAPPAPSSFPCFTLAQQTAQVTQYFSVRAFGYDGSYSNFSPAVSHTIGYRKSKSNEFLQKLYISKDKWDAITLIWESKIELMYQVVKGSGNSIASINDLTNRDLGNVTRISQRNLWRTYNDFLFTWDLETFTNIYYIWFIECDNGVVVTYGAGNKFFGKVPADAGDLEVGNEYSTNISFNKTNSSDIIGYLQVYNWSPTYSDSQENYWIDLTANKSARAVITFNQ